MYCIIRNLNTKNGLYLNFSGGRCAKEMSTNVYLKSTHKEVHFITQLVLLLISTLF